MRPPDEMANGIAGFAEGSALPTPQFLRQISHDASTPLSTIALETYSAQLILRRGMEAASPESQAIILEVQEILGNIAAASRTLNGLMSALAASTTQGQCAAISALGRPHRVDVVPPTDVDLLEEAVRAVDIDSAVELAHPGGPELLPGPARVLVRS